MASDLDTLQKKINNKWKMCTKNILIIRAIQMETTPARITFCTPAQKG